MRLLYRLSKWAVGSLVAVAALAILAWRLGNESASEILAGIGQFAKTAWSTTLLSLGPFQLTAGLVLKGAFLIAILWFINRLVGRFLRTNLDRTELDEGQKFSIQRVSSYLLYAFGALTLLSILGVDLSNLAVFGGALGIGIGLGFQTIAKNFAAGLILLFEQPIKVGDRVQVGDLLGDIVNIGSRGTWVQTNENVTMIVPNSEFVEGRVTNWTANDRNVRLRIPLGVSYSSDPERVREVLLSVVKTHPDVLHQPSPEVRFTGFGDSSLDFDIVIWTFTQVTRPGRIKSQIYFKVFAALKDEGIEIPFPQRDLHLRSDHTRESSSATAFGDEGDQTDGLGMPPAPRPLVATQR